MIERRLSAFPVPDDIEKQWQTDLLINARGVAVDMGMVRGALEIGAQSRDRLMQEAISITGLENPNSIAQLSTWLEKATDTPVTDQFTVSELCSRFSPNNSKSMEQRIRRAVNAGLTNLANMGLEDYSNDTFHDLAGTLYSFEQIRKEMDYIRGKSETHGKVSLKNFLNSLIFYCTN